MKKILVLFLILQILFCCGFKRKQKPIIILSANQITQESAEKIENDFYAKKRIYYALYAPEGFKYPAIRLHISKQEDKTSNWGFSLILTRDIYLDLSKKVYRNYIYIQQKGHYIIQFFYLNNKDYPFAHREFRVY